jgi:ferredoxin-NADP reductase
MRVKLDSRRGETSDIMTFVFRLDGQDYSYTAGQFAFFELDELSTDDPRGKRRHFTLSSSPTEHGIVQFTTKLRGSGYKETLRNAAIGTEVTLEDADGDFVLPKDTAEPLVFLAGGVGVTPFRSMLRYAADEILPYNITMLYAADNPNELAFRREFENLPEEHSNLKIVFVVDTAGENTGYKGEFGRIDAQKISKHVPEFNNALYYSSGPPPMVKAMQKLLQEMGIPEKQIRVEHFSGYN